MVAQPHPLHNLSSAEVLDIENKIYTKEDDRFVALTVKSCVRADHVKNDEKAEEAVNEIHDVKVEEATNEDHEAKAVDAEEIYKRIGDYYREGLLRSLGQCGFNPMHIT